jgi:hypothetical protein
MHPDLTDSEIDEICAGLKQGYAKVRFLERLGLTVRRKPNGRPLVNRAHYNAVMGGGTSDKADDANGPIWGVH